MNEKYLLFSFRIERRQGATEADGIDGVAKPQQALLAPPSVTCKASVAVTERAERAIVNVAVTACLKVCCEFIAGAIEAATQVGASQVGATWLGHLITPFKGACYI